MTLDPQLVNLVEMMSQPGAPRIETTPVEQARAMSQAMAAPRSDVGLELVEDRTIRGPGNDIPIRIYRPEVDGRLPAIVYFHGGGFTLGGIATHDAFAARLATGSGAVVVSVDYRLAPEHPFPAAYEDAEAAATWVAAHGDVLEADTNRLALVGDSAGGNLAAGVALWARDRRAAIALQVLIYPMLDHLVEYRSHVENAEGYLLTRAAVTWFSNNYLPSAGDAADWRASPLRADDLAKVAPAFILTAEFDPLRDEGETYARRLVEAGVPTEVARYEGMVHNFLTLPGVDKAQLAAEQITRSLRDALGSRGTPRLS